MPRELDPNHNLAVTTTGCVQGYTVWVSGPDIRPNPKIINICFGRVLSFVVCAYVANVVHL